MFELGLSDEERLIQETARRFATERLAPRIREHERARGVGTALAAEFDALGLGRLDLPADAAGQGLGALAKALVLEELAAADAGAALALDPLGLALYPLAEGGGDLLPAIRARASVIDDVDCRFRSDGKTVSGSSPWVPADALGLVVILHETRALIVTERIELERVDSCGLDAAGASALTLR
ncbi:MAG: acyl-CoA dehydrogenase family protein, partial [Candidatus Binatia bacterium]